jgi:ribose transport system permease protein
VSVFGAAQVIEHGFFQGMLIVVVLCAVIGLTHGVLVSKGKIPAFIVTMGSMTFLRGAAYVYSNGMPISGLPGGTFAELGNGSFLHIPVPLILVVISFALGFFILKFTVIGRDIYSIGGNEEAALLSGISATKGKIIAFVLSAVFTGIAGMVLTSRVAVGLPTMGDGFQLQAIAAAVIGGTSLKGGEGSMIGTILGILLVSVIGNGLNLLRVSSFVQLMINGVIIVLAVWFDSIKNK